MPERFEDHDRCQRIKSILSKERMVDDSSIECKKICKSWSSKYSIVSALDMPRVKVLKCEDAPSPLNPLGLKGVPVNEVLLQPVRP